MREGKRLSKGLQAFLGAKGNLDETLFARRQKRKERKEGNAHFRVCWGQNKEERRKKSMFENEG